jgi:hypothetical protein
MKTPLKTFLSTSGYFFFHESGSFEEKIFKAVAMLELDEADRSGLIAAVEELIRSPQSNEEMKAYWESFATGVGFDDAPAIRWWLELLVEALRNDKSRVAPLAK